MLQPREDALLLAEAGLLPVPPLLPRFVSVPASSRFVALEQVIAAHLDGLFPGMEILTHHPFRVTRDAGRARDDLVFTATHEARGRDGTAECVNVGQHVAVLAEARQVNVLRQHDYPGAA